MNEEREVRMPTSVADIEDIVSLIVSVIFVIATAVVVWKCATAPTSASCISLGGDYQQAIFAAMSPSSAEVSQTLFKFDRPTVFVTWTKSKWISSFQPKGRNERPRAGADIWVTDASSMKRFCQDFVRSHPGDADALNLRLNQRLGLPPDAVNDTFIEILADPANPGGMFRPCREAYARLDGSTCGAPKEFPKESEVWGEKPQTGRSAELKEWTLRKYYSSYASASPYPWTELGYTFDWSHAEDGSGEFVRFGQTEFVIPKGDPVKFVSAVPTLAYCTPK